MINFPVKQIQDGVILVVRNLVPTKMKLSKADGVYLCQLNEKVTITITSLVTENGADYEYEYALQNIFMDVEYTLIGTFNPCTGYNVVAGDVVTVELTMEDHQARQQALSEFMPKGKFDKDEKEGKVEMCPGCKVPKEMDEKLSKLMCKKCGK